jgi:hypothetical protein
MAAVVLIVLMGMTAATQSISIQLEANTFTVVGWAPPASAPAGGWQSLFTVRAEGLSTEARGRAGRAKVDDVPAMAGRYAVERGALIFRPAYPLAAGVTYHATFQPARGERIERTFEGPRADATPTARVEHIYPSADVLPSNELKLYIYFSASMSRGEAAQRIHILDAAGKPLNGVFLPGEELWDPKVQRLTVIFDPGRIKRGLTSNEKMGPPIVPGKQYTLVIDREWKDARGAPMVDSYRKMFRGAPADRQPPEPKQWRIVAPKAGSSSALAVIFPEPMDYALLLRMIQVSDARGHIDGSIAIDRNETEWKFTPRDGWKPGPYRLVVDTAIEDLAGNHIGQPFDVDVFEKVTEHITTRTIDLPFDVR